MTEEEIIDYVMKTPENTNPAILKDLLGSSNEGQGFDKVFWVTYTFDPIASEESDKSVYTCDHTFQEILEAAKSNKVILAKNGLLYNDIYHPVDGTPSSITFNQNGWTEISENVFSLYSESFTHDSNENIIHENIIYENCTRSE